MQMRKVLLYYKKFGKIWYWKTSYITFLKNLKYNKNNKIIFIPAYV